ncbi:MAG: hypothetical protein EWV49_21065 [Microcystis aeruginosa Ma_QC_Ch_20071001_S25]|uniref:Uncharacterized protein n=1 Tax=Microcystis aeruginosa Ma_QC_Ch_20071001_S25D TaxID=2486250 RepID=A0A552FQX6_MICAE|nr:MAG: hypothetical protein EWV49_21065 [Microcystis aeruginosa Ma_QC_Ch_20071001_S25]TRU49119.1 MAG: hypothetical protein EWV57_12980 [Microcystis aeruginosa Ma_QC_Ch_20071001_S25D]TRU63584.1 MAG: hypothetical protein EWV90_08345 [Microcystis aeruginosa Ma_QC_Ch_20071001_M135]
MLKLLLPAPFSPLPGSLNTKSVEYRLHIRRGTHARGTHAKGSINNQFLITRFSIVKYNEQFR